MKEEIVLDRRVVGTAVVTWNVDNTFTLSINGEAFDGTVEAVRPVAEITLCNLRSLVGQSDSALETIHSVLALCQPGDSVEKAYNGGWRVQLVVDGTVFTLRFPEN